MEYVASLSYGKDSIAMLWVIKLLGLPLDRIVHIEIMATPDIPADLPPMVEFKKFVDRWILREFNIVVEHIHAPLSYEEWFYAKFQTGKRRGTIYGFPFQRGAWCNDRLKVRPLRQFAGKKYTQYVGIAADEPERLERLDGTNKTAPLALADWTEQQAYDWCKSNNLLSPIYADSARGGCWFCHNQDVNQLRILRRKYPSHWRILLKWDKDSPVKFKAHGQSVADFERRFAAEDMGLVPSDKTFRWSMLEVLNGN